MASLRTSKVSGSNPESAGKSACPAPLPERTSWTHWASRAIGRIMLQRTISSVMAAIRKTCTIIRAMVSCQICEP